MICTFIRSSLLNEFTLCPGKAFISYGIGLRGKANRSALVGSVVHGVLEMLALFKLTHQKGESIVSHDSFGDWTAELTYQEHLLKAVYNYYDKESPGLFDDKSYNECSKLVDKALEFQNGMMDPRKANIIMAEYAFDFDIDKPWGAFRYNSPVGTVEGRVAIKGTVDLVCEEDRETLWVTDYKTGKTIQDWGTGKDKNEQTLKDDPQLQLYFYALAHNFPYKNIIMNLYFIRLDKCFTIIFDRKDLPKIESYIQKRYEEIIRTDKPTFIDRSPNKWKCRFCNFSKDLQPGTKKTICRYYQDELTTKGCEQTMLDNANFSMINKYGAGGSIASRE